jgi:hypothetical protein
MTHHDTFKFSMIFLIMIGGEPDGLVRQKMSSAFWVFFSTPKEDPEHR